MNLNNEELLSIGYEIENIFIREHCDLKEITFILENIKIALFFKQFSDKDHKTQRFLL
jgi:hypothetical protein